MSGFKLRRYKRGLGYSYTLGMTVTIEMLLHAPEYADAVFLCGNTARNENSRYLETLCRERSVNIEVNDKAFNILSPKGNCFVIGAFRKFSREIAGGSHIVLVNPSDDGNVGTIIRTAVGFDIPDIAVIRPAADIFDPKTVRASMGAVFRARFSCFDGFGDYRLKYPYHNIYPFILNEKSAQIRSVTFDAPFSLVFGSESAGLPESFAHIEGGTPVIIPHSGAIDSLNLPIAAGVAMFAATSFGSPLQIFPKNYI